MVGACGASEDIDTTSSTQFPSTAVEDFDSGVVPTSTAGLRPQVSEVTPQDQATPTPENSGSPLGTPGLIWSLGMVGAVHLLAGL